MVPERTGVLRYFVRVAEKIVWRDRPEDVIQYLPLRQDLPPGVEPRRLISIIFIPASVFDNPALQQVNPEYYPLLERGVVGQAIETARVSVSSGSHSSSYKYQQRQLSAAWISASGSSARSLINPLIALARSSGELYAETASLFVATA